MSARLCALRLPLLALVAALGCAASPAMGQSVLTITDIVADVAPGLDLGTTVTSDAGVHTIDGGTLAGPNLFHSFATFSLAQAESANWIQSTGDPASIANVVNRVTGGSTSYISGLIDSTEIPNADFWFINPAGVVFGQGAEINVPASVHFSTAGALRFADGEDFQIAIPDGSILSVSNPTAFGFFGGEGDIVFEGSQVYLGGFFQGRGSLTATNIALLGADVAARDLTIVAVGEGPAEVALDGATDTVPSGELLLVGSAISGINRIIGPGAITVKAGLVSLGVGSRLAVVTLGSVSGGDLAINADRVALLGGSAIFSIGVPGSTGAAGDVLITTNELSVEKASRVDSVAFGAGGGGDIEITAGTVDLGSGSRIFSQSSPIATGRGGDIVIKSGDLALTDGAIIRSDAAGASDSGAIVINAESIALSGNSLLLTQARTGSTGNSGVLALNADSVSLSSLSSIRSEALGEGRGGDLTIGAGAIALNGNALLLVQAGRGSTGNAGTLALHADSVSLSTGGSIQSAASGEGRGGDILIEAGTLTLTDAGSIFSSTFRSASGDAGDIRILASNNVNLGPGTVIQNSSGGVGNSGDLILSAPVITATSALFSALTFGTGDGGHLIVNAAKSLNANTASFFASAVGTGATGDILITGGEVTLFNTFIGAQPAETDAPQNQRGKVGDITIAATGALSIAGGTITTQTNGAGDAGNIFLRGGSIALRGIPSGPNSVFNAGINTNTGSFEEGATGGKAGSVLINSDGQVTLEDVIISASSQSFCFEICSIGDAGGITILGDNISLSRSVLSSDAGQGANAGAIRLAADGLLDVSGSSLTSDAFGESGIGGSSGAISLTGQTIRVTDFSSLTASTGAGEGGAISLVGDAVTVANSSLASNAFQTGTAGGITLSGNSIVTDGADFDTSVIGSGDAGTISLLSTGQLSLSRSFFRSDARNIEDFEVIGDFDPFALIEMIGFEEFERRLNAGELPIRISVLEEGGLAGEIAVTGADVFLDETTITAETFGSGPNSFGGIIGITGSRFLALRNTFITSDTFGGSDAGGVILQGPVDPGSPALTITNGQISSNTKQAGNAGLVGIYANAIRIDGATISSSAIDTGNAGIVLISANSSLDLINNANILSNSAISGIKGAIEIGAVDLLLDNSTISAVAAKGSRNDGTFGQIRLFGPDFSTAQAITLRNGSAITTDTTGTGDGGDIEITAVRLEVADSMIQARSVACMTFGCVSGGPAGTISIAAKEVVVSGSDPDMRAAITSNTETAGRAGDIAVAGLSDTRPSLTLSGSAATISSQSSSAGNAGNISLDLASLTIEQGAKITTTTTPAATGQGGSITIDLTGDLAMRTAGGIEADTNFICPVSDCGDQGKGGKIVISARQISLTGSGMSDDTTYVRAESNGSADAGQISLRTIGDITLGEGAFISSDSTGSGMSGGVSLDLGGKLSLDKSDISADSLGSGASGNVVVGASEVILNNSSVTSDALGEGSAGSTTVVVRGSISLTNGAFISSDAAGGDAGGVNITARDLSMASGSYISSDVLFPGSVADGTPETSIAADGNGGNVNVNISRDLSLSSGARISSSTAFGTTGNSGQVVIDADNILLSQGAIINSDSRGDGDALLLSITARNNFMSELSGGIFAPVVLSSSSFGNGHSGIIQIRANSLDLFGGFILASSFGGGNAQQISIQAQEAMLDSVVILADSRNLGNAGGVDIRADSLNIRNGSSLQTFAVGSGAAGIIDINVQNFILDNSRIVSQSRAQDGGLIFVNALESIDLIAAFLSTDSTGAGDAGAISLRSGSIAIRSGSGISSTVSDTSTGRSGLVLVSASGDFSMREGSVIITSSANANPAGTIDIEAANISIGGTATENGIDLRTGIISSNTGSGDAGAISITQTATGLNSGITLTEGALITTSSRSANAGTITIDMGAGSILRLIGRTQNAIIDTSGKGGGQVFIGQTSAPYAVLLDGGSITALGGTDRTMLQIDADFLIRSTDRFNQIAIGQGEEVGLQFEDVSSGIVTTSLEVIDASKVLSGACPVARATGQFSQLTKPVTGPYAREPEPIVIPPVSNSQKPGEGTSIALAGSCR